MASKNFTATFRLLIRFFPSMESLLTLPLLLSYIMFIFRGGTDYILSYESSYAERQWIDILFYTQVRSLRTGLKSVIDLDLALGIFQFS